VRFYFKTTGVRDDTGYSTADLSSATIDVDEMISLLEKLRNEGMTVHEIPIRCDDWYRGSESDIMGGKDPCNKHSQHRGTLQIVFYKQ
jgi:hypothetical protein